MTDGGATVGTEGAGRREPTVWRWLWGRVPEVFGADLRSLAVFRVVLALVVLADLGGRATDLRVHYSDDGVLPWATAAERLDRWQLTVNSWNGSVAFQALVFAVAAAAAVAMLVGWRTRAATFVVWALVLSIQWRNTLLLNDADGLLRLLLFWSLFLPLGARWSVDAARGAEPPRASNLFLSVGTAGLFLQIAFMYWFTALLKDGPEWRENGTAIYYALSNGQYVTPLGDALTRFPELLRFLSFGTIALEAIGPFLLFSPFRTATVRIWTVLAFFSLHIGIMLTMDLGVFPWLSAFCMACFLPGRLWDEALPAVQPAVRPVVAGVAARAGRARGVLGGWGAAPAMARARLWAAGTGGRAALAGVAAGGVGGAAMVPGGGAGRAEVPELGDPAAGRAAPAGRGSSRRTNLLAAGFVAYVFVWNVGTVSAEVRVPESVRPLGDLLGLKQSWGMFAPGPTKSTRWFVVPGVTRDGREVDLLPAVIHDDPDRVQPVSWERPASLRPIFEDKYWRKYLGRVREDEWARDTFLRYVCADWNAAHEGGDELATVRFVSIREETLPDRRRGEAEPRQLGELDCA